MTIQSLILPDWFLLRNSHSKHMNFLYHTFLKVSGFVCVGLSIWTLFFGVLFAMPAFWKYKNVRFLAKNWIEWWIIIFKAFQTSQNPVRLSNTPKNICENCTVYWFWLTGLCQWTLPNETWVRRLCHSRILPWSFHNETLDFCGQGDSEGTINFPK